MIKNNIKLYDISDMFSVLANFGNQIFEASEIGNGIVIGNSYESINKIIVCGLGGSAIGGDLLRSVLWYEIKIPILVNRNYSLPSSADSNTLAIFSSYSGNTEETLTAYEEAKIRGCRIICISSGGKLSLLAENDNNYLIKIPKGYQPRCAIAYSFFPLLILLSKLGLIGDKTDIIRKIINRVRNRSEIYTSQDENINSPLKMAGHILGKIPIIYSSCDVLDIVNLRWKDQFNENAKMLAFGNVFPELNHNEIVGWQENPETLKKLAIISMKDIDDLPPIQKRMKITMEMISPLAGLFIEVDGEGSTKLERIFDLIYLGDWVSYYLAVLNKIDPTPVEKINYLKNKMSES